MKSAQLLGFTNSFQYDKVTIPGLMREMLTRGNKKGFNCCPEESVVNLEIFKVAGQYQRRKLISKFSTAVARMRFFRKKYLTIKFINFFHFEYKYLLTKKSRHETISFVKGSIYPREEEAVEESLKKTRGQALKLAYEQCFGLTGLKILAVNQSKQKYMGNITAHQVLSPKGEGNGTKIKIYSVNAGICTHRQYKWDVF
jgi:hypothetical protein